MRAISCAIISLVFFHQAINVKGRSYSMKTLVGFFVTSSWVFLTLAIVFMALGL